MTDIRIVLTTAGSQSEARRIAEVLVERKLAACVNIISRVQSIYRWEGKTQETEEWLLVIKSMKDSFAKLKDAIKELHPYELPECLSLTVEEGSEEYLNWVKDSMTK